MSLFPEQHSYKTKQSSSASLPNQYPMSELAGSTISSSENLPKSLEEGPQIHLNQPPICRITPAYRTATYRTTGYDESPPSLKESLGLNGLLEITIGSLGVVLLFGILVFLWFGRGGSSDAANAFWVWRQIAIRGWITQAITLSTLTLQADVNLQSAVCTSMLASLYLERRNARKAQVGWLSVMRGLNNGPWKLARVILSSPSLDLILCLEFWLMILMAITTMALQFSSTILLSDIKTDVIVGNSNRTMAGDLLEITSRDQICWMGCVQLYEVKQ
ncbi:hypothetical protein F5Y16DRAFT_228577 [Xylariaceae sp. FL0255]|nr:hypothetical protein F5Y16DRAFT_228577 [Xylariaceae sp. FL0255]